MAELPVEKLRRSFDAQSLGFATTEGLPPLEGIIGQPRALEALRFGLGIADPGFNLYVAGPQGSGRTTAVKAFLEEAARQKDTPSDWCYLHNFSDPYRPWACPLPAGRGRELREDMKILVDRARREVPLAFESERYSARREEIVAALNRQREKAFTELGQEAQAAGLTLQATPMGILILPMVEGRPLSDQEFLALPETVREALRRRREALEEKLNETMKQIRELEKVAQEQLQKLDREVAFYVVGGLLAELLEKYQPFPRLVSYLEAVREDIIRNLDVFRQRQAAAAAAGPQAPWVEDIPFRKYEVNLMVDNSGRQGAPVVLELNPTYNNLFGRIEKETQFGALNTDFTLVRPGSLHQANGGYLVIPIEELLRNLFAYEGLKRAVRNREVIIEEMGERLGFLAAKSLRPEPIPLAIKVVLIGSPLLYHLLYALDEDFNELFKVKVDFDSRMDNAPQNIRDYVGFICTLCRKENLRHLDSEAVAKIIEHSSRLADDQEKLSTRFGEIADVIREADFWAGQDGSAQVSGRHVHKAIEAKVYRSNLIQERIQEMIERGTLLIRTTGEAVGQVNGLSVINLGDYAFGRPSRITASIGLGRGGVVDIEREAKLGGPIHTKGVLILGGYLAQKYAQDKPLSLSARLVFEQSYEAVEGDSASSAELYALLSALAGLPIKQGIAVTGSVNQRGELQAIGGVNQKIEGFFDVCKVQGLDGEQGVLIPEANVKNLMLREDVLEAVRDGQFHIWAVRTVDEGIELLTAVPAGERGPDGTFPEDSVNGRVDRRLREMAQGLRGFVQEEQRVTGEAEEE